MEIKVFGPGCARCQAVYRNTEAALAQRGFKATIVKVTDPFEMSRYGVNRTPAISVDGVLKAQGRIPTQDEISRWLS